MVISLKEVVIKILRCYQSLPLRYHLIAGKVLLSLPTSLLNLLCLVYAELFEASEPDPEMLPFLSNVTKGYTVLEVGSGTGRFTRLLCERVGKNGLVIACEPNPIAFLISKKYLRHSKNVVLLNLGLGAVRDTFRILTMQGPADCAASVYALSKDNVLRVKCRFTTLDQLIVSLKLQKLDMIIMDVEGAELEVLEGAKNTLKIMKPWILIELHPKVRHNIIEEVKNKLASYGYKGTIFSIGSETVTYSFQTEFNHASL